MIGTKRAADVAAGDRLWWADSDTGPLSLATVLGASDLGANSSAGFLAGRVQIAVRLEDSSVRRAVRDADEVLLVDADEPAKAKPKPSPSAET